MSWIRRLLTWLLDDPPRRRKVQVGKNGGIGKVLLSDGEDHAGMGIIIDPLHMITCAHVVNAALGPNLLSREQPDQSVRVTFPMIAEPDPYQATVAQWRPPGPMPQDDIAILRFEKEVPSTVGVAVLADVTGVPLDDDDLSIFGLPTGKRLGNHVDARFKGTTSAAWVQLDGVRGQDFVAPGFSGGAVWDNQHAATVGMLVAGKPGQDVAYMIPIADLREFWPSCPVERRPLGPMFARTWTIFSAAYFFLLLAHFGWDRGVSAFAPVTLSGEHKVLAAFWGMIIYVAFAPWILGMLIRFSKSLRLHDWTARVPSFGRFGVRAVSSTTWRTASVSLIAFVLLPLAAQIHFVKRFHENGYVYVYPRSFGYTSDDPVFQQEKCFKEGTDLCTKNDAGRYSLAAPKPGASADYWTNAYHYGDRSGGDGSTVTFFPILEPLIILLVTAVSAVLSGIALFLVLRPTPEIRIRKALETIRSTDGAVTRTIGDHEP